MSKFNPQDAVHDKPKTILAEAFLRAISEQLQSENNEKEENKNE